MPPAVRSFVACLLCVTALVTWACGDPPDKELQQAQGAIDTARAAGADKYARDEYTAAQDALKRANDAVAARDYRLALNHALDARERAQDAAKEAVNGKATARSDADRALTDAKAALDDARARLKASQGTRVNARAIAAPRRVVEDGEQTVQKAGAAFQAGEYLEASDGLKGVASRLRDAAREIDTATAAAAKPAARPRRR